MYSASKEKGCKTGGEKKYAKRAFHLSLVAALMFIVWTTCCWVPVVQLVLSQGYTAVHANDVGGFDTIGLRYQSPTQAQWRDQRQHAAARVFRTLDSRLISNALTDLDDALDTMQTAYFEVWTGTWPKSIDWTAAVLGTYLSASMASMARSLDETTWPTGGRLKVREEGATSSENAINMYFSQLISFYFGQNAMEMRYQAYDDMLWVVLGWLDSTRFIQSRTSYHKSEPTAREGLWYGHQFVPAFAHRARIFYDLAKSGWDTKLCGGGMNWNPRLSPYKNAITNQLFISASVAMYLYFPGDDIKSPFSSTTESDIAVRHHIEVNATWNWNPSRPHNPAHLQNAIEAYSWLANSNMTNDIGLYVDGFHVHDYGVNSTIGTGKCDERNEMVYTYNQGVILSGLRGLWESTGEREYLEAGHGLIRNVLEATGWATDAKSAQSDTWSGLGRNGVLEELCDSSATCSQDGQAFKGIFFHHLTAFCEPLPQQPSIPGVSHAADRETATLHSQSCHQYAPWVVQNAMAALETRDAQGQFGMWWGSRADAVRNHSSLPQGASDYRNAIKACAEPWLLCPAESPSNPENTRWGTTSPCQGCNDLNDRGRGRTVETQGAGVAVVRAMWQFLRNANE